MADRLTGVGVSGGTAVGPAYVVISQAVERRTDGTVDENLLGFDSALALSIDQLTSIAERLEREGRHAEAEIVGAQILMLQDDALINGVRERIEHGTELAQAVQEEAARISALFAGMDDEYLAARSEDVRDVMNRIVRNATGARALDGPDTPSILIAHELAPSDTAALDRTVILGIAVDTGSPTSHTAILARSLNIPAVVGLRDVTSRIRQGQRVALDGDKGLVILDPEQALLREFRVRQTQRERDRQRLTDVSGEPAATRDGSRVKLEANIGGPEDVAAALEVGAEGIGLFRTEFLFHGRGHLPGEDEQTAAYGEVLRMMRTERVVIRTLDVGGDKPLPAMEAVHEDNPFLGLRGLRFTLSRLDVFKTQLRALMRASIHGHLAVMFPMVTTIGQVEQARELLEDARAEVGGHVEVGIMIEVPAAALISHQLAQHVDFFSVGTNDLVQYTLAVDRVNASVASLYEPLHPSVLRLLAETVQAAKRGGRAAGVCGEMAADPVAIPLLLGLGFRELSMTPSRIPLAKAIVRRLEMTDCLELAEQALRAGSAVEVEAAVRHRLPVVTQFAPQ